MKEIRWSQWLESLRKDVKCTFGILKGRWRILKTGIRLHTLASADRVWKTCCALHNRLLDIDGLDQKWENGVRSNWEGNLGHHEHLDTLSHVSFAIQRTNVLCPDARNFDSSGMGAGDDGNGGDLTDNYVPPAAIDDNLTTVDGVRVVRHLSLNFFRSKLVEHFDIRWQQHDIEWPKGSTCKPTL